MRTSCTVALVLLTACGRAALPVAPEPDAVGPDGLAERARTMDDGETTLEPGWHEVPVELASLRLGTISLEQWDNLLAGTVDAPGLGVRRVYLAVWWGSGAPEQIAGPFAHRASYRALLPAPPQSARTSAPTCRGERAQGVLLAYALAPGAAPSIATDPLIGASYKPPSLFPGVQTAFNRRVEWSSCAREGAVALPPLVLQDDPRLPLAICEHLDVAQGVGCGIPLVDRTRVEAAVFSISASGSGLSPSFVHHPAGRAVRYVINGQPVGTGFWQLSTTGPGAWREGRNTVEITIEGLTPWRAVLVLPSRRLEPLLLSPLRRGERFAAQWTPAPWADAYLVTLYPLDVPARRIADPRWTVTTASIRELFPGFEDGGNQPLWAPRAELGVTAMRRQGPPSASPHGGGRFELWVREAIVVPVAP